MSMSLSSQLGSAPIQIDVMPVTTRDSILDVLKNHASSSAQITTALRTDQPEVEALLRLLFTYEIIEYKRNISGDRIYFIGPSEAKSVGEWNAVDF